MKIINLVLGYGMIFVLCQQYMFFCYEFCVCIIQLGDKTSSFSSFTTIFVRTFLLFFCFENNSVHLQEVFFVACYCYLNKILISLDKEKFFVFTFFFFLFFFFFLVCFYCPVFTPPITDFFSFFFGLAFFSAVVSLSLSHL